MGLLSVCIYFPFATFTSDAVIISTKHYSEGRVSEAFLIIILTQMRHCYLLLLFFLRTTVFMLSFCPLPFTCLLFFASIVHFAPFCYPISVFNSPLIPATHSSLPFSISPLTTTFIMLVLQYFFPFLLSFSYSFLFSNFFPLIRYQFTLLSVSSCPMYLSSSRVFSSPCSLPSFTFSF